MTAVQTYLRGGGSLEGLKSTFAVYSRRHATYPNLVLLKYDQIASPFAEHIVCECRGLILDEADDWRIVSRSFDKFFNHGEVHAAPIDWNTARVQEKLDGSLAVLYWYDGAWHVQTSGTPDACGHVNGVSLTFQDYFWTAYGVANGSPISPAHKDLCFAFELMGPLNRVVVVHPETKLRLLAVRDRVTGEQFPPETFAEHIGIPAVQSFPLQSWDDIKATFDTMNPLSQEGYVVVDAHHRRVKVKHPGYVALHHAKDGMSQRAFLDISRNGETSEVVASFPEFKPLLEATKAKYEAFVAAVEADYARLQGVEAQKDFALEAMKTGRSTALFQIRKGTPLREFLKRVPIRTLEDWVGVTPEETASEVTQ